MCVNEKVLWPKSCVKSVEISYKAKLKVYMGCFVVSSAMATHTPIKVECY